MGAFQVILLVKICKVPGSAIGHKIRLQLRVVFGQCASYDLLYASGMEINAWPEFGHRENKSIKTCLIYQKSGFTSSGILVV
jgi:hypothetical protein